MDFGRYLLFKGLLTKGEYRDILSHQFGHGLGGAMPTHIDEIEDLASIRPFPFGEVLAASSFAGEFFSRVGKSLGELVDEWHEWHRGRLEPISSYSTTSKFGRELYVRQAEKKYVAQYLVGATAPDGSTIIQENDRVIITEGSSGLYVGLGIAAASHNTEIITSSGCLLREYRDNPAVARRFRKVCVVGGEVDYDMELNRSEHDGVHGDLCKELDKALKTHPPATVVVITGSFLSANAGPATIGPTASLKANIIREALKIGVRKVVFVADYTKHIRMQGRIAGNQVFSSDEWHAVVANNKERIHIVTSPPPALRALLVSGQGNDVRRRTLENFSEPPISFTDEDHFYNTAARELQDLVGGEMIKHDFCSRFSEAYEDIFPTLPTSLTFTIDPATGFTENAFREELAKYSGKETVPYEVRVRQEGDQLRVVVIGWGVGGRLLRKLILDQKSQRIVQFAMRTSTRAITGNVAGKSLSLTF